MTTVYLSQLDEPTLADFARVIETQNPSTIVLLCETEWHSRELTIELANLLNSHKIKLIVTFGSYPSDYYQEQTKYFNDIEIVHWNTYWLNWALMCSNHLDFNRTYTDFKYPFICLNNKNWTHRCMLVDELTGQGLLDKGIVTWNKFNSRHFSPYQFKYYDDNVRLLSDNFETILDSFLIPEEYHQSFLHVIGEATTTVTMISEKTCLPILFKKPFVVMADQYFHQKLVDLGFELYDEIIDYSFDSEPDMLKRAEAIALNVKRISEQNTTELYQRIKDKARRNYDNYISIVNSVDYVPKVIIDRVIMIRAGTKMNATDGRYEYMLNNMKSVADFNIWNPNLLNDVEDLMNNPGRTNKIIFNGAIEFDSDRIQGSKEKFRELVEFANQNDIECHLITGSHSSDNHINNDGLTVHYWPTFWLTMALNRLLVSPNYQTNVGNCLDIENIRVCEKTPLKYPYISMNKAPKHHRAMLMDLLAKHDILNDGVVIWRELNEAYPFEHWNQEILLRDQKQGFKYQEILPMEYALTFMQLVPETDENIFTLSEKTAMPLFFNKPFLVAGSKGFHAKLKDMGFKLYDELFDYGFDDVEDTKLRYEMIVENVKRYTDKTPKELQSIYDSVFEKCVFNKRMALHLATKSGLVPTIWKDLVKNHMYYNVADYPGTLDQFIENNEHVYKL